MKKYILIILILLIFIPNNVYATRYKCTYQTDTNSNNFHCSRKDGVNCDVNPASFAGQQIRIIFDDETLEEDYRIEINVDGSIFTQKYNLIGMGTRGVENYVDNLNSVNDFCSQMSTIYFACGKSTTYNCQFDPYYDNVSNIYVEEYIIGNLKYVANSQVLAESGETGSNTRQGILNGEDATEEEIVDASGQNNDGSKSTDNTDMTGGFTFAGGNCNGVKDIQDLMTKYINTPLKTLAVVLLVVLTIVDFVKNIGDKDADPKKPFNNLIKRAIACAILFFASDIIDILLDLTGMTSNCGNITTGSNTTTYLFDLTKSLL